MRDRHFEDITWQVYRLLLVLYPSSYRREYGREMSLAFRDYCRRTARRRGMPGLFQIWLTMGVDLLATALVERLSEVKDMSTRSAARLLGVIGTIGGVYCVVIGFVWVIAGQTAADALPFLPFYAIAITIGTLGLFLSSDNLGPNTKAGAAAAFVGMALATIGLLLMWLDLDIGWGLWFLGGQILHPIGLIVFGVTMQNVPASWKATPIAVGALTIVLSFASSQLEAEALFGVWFFIFGLGWILLGQMPSLARAKVRA